MLEGAIQLDCAGNRDRNWYPGFLDLVHGVVLGMF